MIRWIALVVASAGCSGAEPFDCGEVAISTTGGAADDCDLQACQACVDACGGDCVVLESFPPQYSCGADGSWSVYDFCEDWTLPTATAR